MADWVWIYSVVLFAGSVAMAVAVLLYARMRVRRNRVRRALERCYLSILNRRLLEGGEQPCVFPLIERRHSRLILATVVARLGAVTYGYDRKFMAEIVRRYALDRLLMRQALFSFGMRRVQWLHTFAMIDSTEVIYRRTVLRFGRSRNRYMALCMTLAALNHNPERSIAILAERRLPLSAFDLSEVLMMLKRGLIPVAYQPLLHSEYRNVQMLGLCIVRYFGVTEAEEDIVSAISSADSEVASSALFTLCALRLRLDRDQVRQASQRMSEEERRAWYRHLAAEGYSSRAIAKIVPANEQPQMREYVEQTVASYKRCLTN